jgi:hypothetical protein
VNHCRILSMAWRRRPEFPCGRSLISNFANDRYLERFNLGPADQKTKFRDQDKGPTGKPKVSAEYYVESS